MTPPGTIPPPPEARCLECCDLAGTAHPSCEPYLASPPDPHRACRAAGRLLERAVVNREVILEAPVVLPRVRAWNPGDRRVLMRLGRYLRDVEYILRGDQEEASSGVRGIVPGGVALPAQALAEWIAKIPPDVVAREFYCYDAAADVRRAVADLDDSADDDIAPILEEHAMRAAKRLLTMLSDPSQLRAFIDVVL